MSNGNIIYYILVYGQVLLQITMYISIIYLIFWPLREVLYSLLNHLEKASSPPIDLNHREQTPLSSEKKEGL